jgi:hypothetical protein
MQRNSTQPSPLRCPQIDEIWLHAAGQLGFAVIRSESAYASTDGRGTIIVGTDDTLDIDDCVAQLVFHELCHALVEGESKLQEIDWGLENTNERDISREYSALRLQAHLSDSAELRTYMPPTTQWRPYYESLPNIAIDGNDEAADVVRAVIRSSLFARWEPILLGALASTSICLRDGARMQLSQREGI